MWFFWIVMCAALAVYTAIATILMLFFVGVGVAFMTMVVGFAGAFYCGNKAEGNL